MTLLLHSTRLPHSSLSRLSPTLLALTPSSLTPFFTPSLTLYPRDSVAEWSKACDSKSLLLWRRRFESCRCRFSLFRFDSIYSITSWLLHLDFYFSLHNLVRQCGRVVKAIDLKSISLWDRRFESCHCRFILSWLVSFPSRIFFLFLFLVPSLYDCLLIHSPITR